MALLDRLGERELNIRDRRIAGRYVGLELALWYPWDVSRVVQIAACGRHSAWCIGQSEAQRAAIKADAKRLGGRYEEKRSARGRACRGAHGRDVLVPKPPQLRAKAGRRRARRKRPFPFKVIYVFNAKKLAERFDDATARSLDGIDGQHDLSRGRGITKKFKEFKIPALIAGYDSGRPLSDRRTGSAGAAYAVRKNGATSTLLGHDSFLIDPTDLIECVKKFREEEKGRLE
jgi:homoserine O-acetyltransferase